MAKDTPASGDYFRDASQSVSRASNAWNEAWSGVGNFFGSAARAQVDIQAGIQQRENELFSGAISAIGDQFNRENPGVGRAISDATNAVGNTLSSIGNGAASAAERVAGGMASRPLTTAMEMAIPGLGPQLALADAAMRGPAGQTGAPREATHAPTPPAPEHQAQQAAPAHRVETQQQPPHGETHSTHHSASVHKGDGYWNVAHRILGVNASNRAIANMAKHLEQRNGNKMLHTGDHIQY